MGKRILNEMYEILGGQQSSAYAGPAIDPKTPHEAVGTFMVYGVTAIEEMILDSISDLTWEQIGNIAVLATIGPTDFQSLIQALGEDTSTFRETWNSMVEDNVIPNDMDRGYFVFMSKMCPKTESCTRYVYWCLKTLGEASESTLKTLAEKSPLVKMVIPDGQTMAQRDADVDAAKPFLGKEFVEPYERPDQNEYRAKKLKDVANLEKEMTATAAKMGKKPDEAFTNLFIDLARERARNS